MSRVKIAFIAKLYRWPGDYATWYFIRLPQKESRELHEANKGKHRGWNSLKVEAVIGETVFQTSIFYDTRGKSYLLPIKKSVRTSEALLENDEMTVILTII